MTVAFNYDLNWQKKEYAARYRGMVTSLFDDDLNDFLSESQAPLATSLHLLNLEVGQRYEVTFNGAPLEFMRVR